MTQQVFFDRYPAGIVLVSVLQTLFIYASGAAIMLYAAPTWAALYLAFCLWSEYRVLRKSCVNCVYYGQICAFGRGLVCSWIFRKGDPAAFNTRTPTWAALIPDLLISLLPFSVGTFFLIRSFTWPLVGLMVLLVLLAFPGTGFIRSQLACAHCRQRQLGCPAERLFGREPTA